MVWTAAQSNTVICSWSASGQRWCCRRGSGFIRAGSDTSGSQPLLQVPEHLSDYENSHGGNYAPANGVSLYGDSDAKAAADSENPSHFSSSFRTYRQPIRHCGKLDYSFFLGCPIMDARSDGAEAAEPRHRPASLFSTSTLRSPFFWTISTE